MADLTQPYELPEVLNEFQNRIAALEAEAKKEAPIVEARIAALEAEAKKEAPVVEARIAALEAKAKEEAPVVESRIEALIEFLGKHGIHFPEHK